MLCKCALLSFACFNTLQITVASQQYLLPKMKLFSISKNRGEKTILLCGLFYTQSLISGKLIAGAEESDYGNPTTYVSLPTVL